MRSPALPLLTLAWSWGATAACPAPVTTSALQSAIEEAEAAYADVDVQGFVTSTNEPAAALPCVDEPIPRHLAASVHRVLGLRYFVDRDPERATRAFAAARSVEPDRQLPDSLVPAGHPVRNDYAAIPLESGTFEPAPVLRDGYVTFDGRADAPRPSAWPALLQAFESSGTVLATAYLWPGDPFPTVVLDRLGAPPASDPFTPVAVEPTPRGGPRWVLLGGAVAAAGASGVLYALAAHSARKFDDPATPYGDLAALRGRTNTLVVASGGAGVVALGLGAGAFVSVRW